MFEGNRMPGRLAVIVAAGVLTSSMSISSAYAGGYIGGNCCADLEERVAELESTTVRKGNRRVSLKLAGQVNKGLLVWDDGNRTDTYIVDNSTSGSRFSFSGRAKIGHGLTAGYLVEFEFDSSESDAVTSANSNGNGTNGVLDLRHNAWYLKSRTFGRVTVGQYSPATDNLVLINLGGTGVVATADTTKWNNAFTAVGTGTTWGVALSGIASLDTARGDIIRYDTPSFYGFVASASWGEDDVWDASVKWNGSLLDFRAALGVGYIDNRDNTTADWTAWMGSGSILHAPTGLFLTGAYYDRDVEGVSQDGEMYYVQAGIRQRFLSSGATTLYFEYSNNSDFAVETGAAATSSSAEVWGGGIVQNIDAAAMELYASYRHFDGEVDGVSAQDFDAILTGARIKF